MSNFYRRPGLWFWLTLIVFLLVGGGLMIQPVAAQANTVWSADYYNNAYLIGDAAVSRQDSAVAFNWGASAPFPELNADNFSVRWGADPYFAAGTYRFYALADDAVSVTVDFALTSQIDTFVNPAVGKVVSADVTLSEGRHHIQVDYREVIGDAYVYVTWANLATNPTGPNFPVPVPQQPVQPTGSWTAQYFANASLFGSPLLVVAESSPSHNWGGGSPGAAIPADNFSARWTSVQTLNAGTYRVSAQADDGVRVYVDGVLYINEWHTATGATYSADITLYGGQHNFQVDYYEAGGSAFLNFGLSGVNVPPIYTPPVTNPPTSATGTVVTALRLNVRNAPDAEAPILTKITRNSTYPVLGRNADSSWWQLNVNGTVGWAYWRFLDIANAQAVPVVTASTGPSLNQPTPTQYNAFTLATVNVRSDPTTAGAILAQIARNNQVSVVGRDSSATWWQVNFGRITGWVSSRYAPLTGGAVWQNIPITG
ncbi:MAG: SH3 domain-containing protein [Anaerolineae bacterium]|nr:SH3 domain-containing protein [Anaerolineae bacterium]